MSIQNARDEHGSENRRNQKPIMRTFTCGFTSGMKVENNAKVNL